MKAKKRRTAEALRSAFHFSFRDAFISLILLSCGSALCFGLRPLSDGDFHVPLIFVLVVLLVSIFTDGYLYGLLSSVFSVVAVNYAFTYPYFHLNFTLTGYPLTFFCMFVVSIVTCTLMKRVRRGEQLRLEAEREKMRANLLRAISHDFRTPLTSIIGTLGVISDNENRISPDDRRRLIADAQGDAEWLINMMENILSITRIGNDTAPKIHTEEQVLEEVMAEAITRFRKQYPDMNIKTSIPGELIIASVDAMLIEQVIINLLVNVVLHSQGVTQTRLSLTREGDMALISVEDNGCGITPKALAHLFDGKLAPSSDERHGDSRRTMGIGLSVCNTIIRAHGGTMSAENRADGGAKISFTLPIIKEAENGDPFQNIDC